MKLVLSPSKSFDYESELPINKITKSIFLEDAERIQKLLKKKSAKALSKLMNISNTLGLLNYERYQNWHIPFNSHNARQSVYAYNGDVYKGLDAYTITIDKLEKLQETVRVLSGLYGILRPLDLIQPYRLEMGIKFPVGKNKNLYEYWKQKITSALNQELKEDELFLNLASLEYFKAIDLKALKVPVITVNFKEFKNGTYKNIGIYAKLARGLMARYVIDSNAITIMDIKLFNYERYEFNEKLSCENELVFVR